MVYSIVYSIVRNWIGKVGNHDKSLSCSAATGFSPPGNPTGAKRSLTVSKSASSSATPYYDIMIQSEEVPNRPD